MQIIADGTGGCSNPNTMRIGWTRRDQSWKRSLAAAFRNMAETGAVTKSMASPHGQKYILDCKMETPSGRTPWVWTVWIIDTGLTAPRLVTAYPHDD